MTERKFYRQVVSVEILSEELIDFDNDLEAIAEAITTGECSGVVSVAVSDEVDGLAMARLLEAQGSDPGFFMLDSEGNDTEE
jgi:hypothetical protein